MAPGRAVIASRRLLAADEKGQEFEVTITVGEPYLLSASEWACPASFDGLDRRFADMQGVDSWQALQLAHQMIGQMLVHFVEDGGRLLDPGESASPLCRRRCFHSSPHVAQKIASDRSQPDKL